MADFPPILMCRIGWMERYDGPDPDFYAGNMRRPQDAGWGHEMFNFDVVDDRCYGYVQHGHAETAKKTNLQRLIEAGASDRGDYVDGVFVVWMAKNPDANQLDFVGWYENATVHLKPKTLTDTERRFYNDENFEYRIEAEAVDCHLITLEKRFCIYELGPGGAKRPGQANLFYVQTDGNWTDRNQTVCTAIMEFVQSETGDHDDHRGGRRTAIPQHVIRTVEQAAIQAVWSHYEEAGYRIEDCQQKLGLGYDLRAIKGDEVLCIEVKGRWGSDIRAKFSPNEYEVIRSFEAGRFHDGEYRICIVTGCGDGQERVIHHFVYQKTGDGDGSPAWFDHQHQRHLARREITAAEFFVDADESQDG